MESPDCRNCQHSGWDPDGPYCANPEVVKVYDFGLSLSSMKLVDFCRAPEHPLFKEKEEE